MEKNVGRTNCGVSGPVPLTTSETLRYYIILYYIILYYIILYYIIYTWYIQNVRGITLFLINTKQYNHLSHISFKIAPCATIQFCQLL